MCQNEGTHHIVMSFSPPVVGCLLQKWFSNGGHGHPRTQPRSQGLFPGKRPWDGRHVKTIQNRYWFALIPLSISLSWSMSGLFYCVFSASSLAIMAAWELLS